MFGFGAVFSIPLVAYFNDRFGRKAAIILGTIFAIIGVALQTAAINSKFDHLNTMMPQYNRISSRNVLSRTVHYWNGNVSFSLLDVGYPDLTALPPLVRSQLPAHLHSLLS